MKKKIKNLCKEIIRHEYLYYVKSQPEISDSEFDKLFNELLDLEKQYPEFVLPESPTKRVGSDLVNDFPEVKHEYPMLSLDKCYSIPEMVSWAEKNDNKIGQELSYIIEEKIDGMSIVLTYQKGILVQAATRGNGIIGNDITDNARTVRAIPLKLSEPVDIKVRGEVFIKKSDFKKIKRQEGVSYDSPRNLAAGSLRRKSSNKAAKKPLDIFIYEGLSGDIDQLENHFEIYKHLNKLGFKTNPNTKLFKRPDEDFEAYIEKCIKERDDLDYEIDGLVVKINEKNARIHLGTTDRFPRWAMAFKFESPSSETIIETIDIQIGRLGRVTPVARLKPVKIGGAEVTNATLHNQDYIDSLEVAIGDTVSVSRRGDVIPAVEKVIEKNTSGNTTWKIPQNCVSCESEIIKEGGHHFCMNPQCPDRLKARLIHFAGKTGMDIENMGPKTVELLFEKKFVIEPQDFYKFNPDDLNGIQGFGHKKIKLIKKGIEKSKTRNFETILLALGIKDLGAGTVRTLINNGFNSINKILDVTNKNDFESLVKIEGIAEITAKNLIDAFQSKELIATIESLQDVGFKFFIEKTDDSVKYTQNMTGQRWCITGSFENFQPRSKAKLEIENRGGKVLTSISSKTTHLLAGDKAGSKIKKAQASNIKIITEDDFIKMLE